MPEQVAIKTSLDILWELENPLLHYSAWFSSSRAFSSPRCVAIGAPKEDDFSGSSVHLSTRRCQGHGPSVLHGNWHENVLGAGHTFILQTHATPNIALPLPLPPPVKDANH